jgi:hypothetical protein
MPEDRYTKVIVGPYVGAVLSEEDAEINKRRISSNCFVYENCLYDRKRKQLVPTKNIYVADFHDG